MISNIVNQRILINTNILERKKEQTSYLKANLVDIIPRCISVSLNNCCTLGKYNIEIIVILYSNAFEAIRISQTQENQIPRLMLIQPAYFEEGEVLTMVNFSKQTKRNFEVSGIR